MTSKFIKRSQRLNSVTGKNEDVVEIVSLSAEESAAIASKMSDRSIERRINAAAAIPLDASGYQIQVDTLTVVTSEVSAQKFYTVDVSEFIPVIQGEHQDYQEITIFRTTSNADDFESGNSDLNDNEPALFKADVTVSPIRQAVMKWSKYITYSLPELRSAMLVNNWDLVRAREEARKTNWDLGIQSVAFEGLTSAPGKYKGLLTTTDINVNATLITKPISSMTPTEFNDFLAELVAVYAANTNYTAMPDTFQIPLSDYLGLNTPISPTYPTGLSKLAYLEQSIKISTKNTNFQIIPLAYADAANNPAGKQIYTLYRKDPKTLRMYIPLPYRALPPNTTNNFNFQTVAEGQYTGVVILRPLEVLRFEYTPAL